MSIRWIARTGRYADEWGQRHYYRDGSELLAVCGYKPRGGLKALKPTATWGPEPPASACRECWWSERADVINGHGPVSFERGEREAGKGAFPQPEEDLPLFRGAARSTDPGTSHAAARKVDASGLCASVLEAVRSAGTDGMTSLEASARVAPEGVDPVAYLQSVSPRFAQLEALGAVRVVEGLRRDRRQVWVARERDGFETPSKAL